MGLIFFQFGVPVGPSDPVGPFDFTIRMGSRKVGGIRWVVLGFNLFSVSRSAWTSDGRPSGGPFQLSHPDGPPEGGSHPVGLDFFSVWPSWMAAHPVGPSDPVGPFNFTFRMGSGRWEPSGGFNLFSVWRSAWTSDGRPSGGPFQLSHPDGPPEGGSHPVGLNFFSVWPSGWLPIRWALLNR